MLLCVGKALLTEITLPNTVFSPALRDLLLVESVEGLGPVDFRSLGVLHVGWCVHREAGGVRWTRLSF